MAAARRPWLRWLLLLALLVAAALRVSSSAAVTGALEEQLDEELQDSDCVLLQLGLQVDRRGSANAEASGVALAASSVQQRQQLQQLQHLQQQQQLLRMPRMAQHSSLVGAVLGLGDADKELATSLEAGLLSALLLVLCIVLFFLLGARGTAASEDTPEGSAGGRSRLAVLDNAKFLLMVLIVIDHAKGNAEKYWGWEVGVPQLEAITQCHTRIYCFLSGVVAKDPPSKRGFRNLFTRLILPIVLFSLIDPLLILSRDYLLLVKTDLLLAKCVYMGPAVLVPIWYLHALVLWRLGGWLIHPLPPQAKFLVAFAVSALGGYLVPLRSSALEPAAVFFVIYVAGQLCPMEDLLKKLPFTRISAVVGLLLLVASSIWLSSPSGLAFMDDASVPIWGWSVRTHESDLASALFWLRGLFRHSFELSRGFAFLFLCCPRSPGQLADWGQRSLYAYLLNNSLLTDLTKVIHIPSRETPLGQMLQLEALLVFSCMLAAVLSMSWVRELFRPILEPQWLEDLLFRDGKAAVEKSSAGAAEGKVISDRSAIGAPEAGSGKPPKELGGAAACTGGALLARRPPG